MFTWLLPARPPLKIWPAYRATVKGPALEKVVCFIGGIPAMTFVNADISYSRNFLALYSLVFFGLRLRYMKVSLGSSIQVSLTGGTIYFRIRVSIGR